MDKLPWILTVAGEMDPRWLTSTVLDLAAAIVVEQAWDRLPILADALQDAGCDSDLPNLFRRAGTADWLLRINDFTEVAFRTFVEASLATWQPMTRFLREAFEKGIKEISEIVCSARWFRSDPFFAAGYRQSYESNLAILNSLRVPQAVLGELRTGGSEI